MSDISTDTGPENVDDDSGSPAISEIREAEKRATAAAKEAQAEAASAQKELAFIRAGVDPAASKVAELFYQTYENELTPEAIQAGAAELGLSEPPAPADPSLGADLASAVRTSESTAGDAQVADPTPSDEDPAEAGMKAFSQAVKDGVPADIASTEYFNSMIGAAVAGDQRAIWTPQKHAAEVEEYKAKGYDV
jgi:hypothetical protein